jgi:ubiquinone/menaquinone biosynthesis C-methylase UbiE
VASAGVPLNDSTTFPPGRGPHDPGERASRFHTARGPMGPAGWLRYPAAWWRARRGVTPERPWIVPAAIAWLGRRLRSDWSVLELGAGRSTPWLARHAGRVISFEDNEFWAEWTLGRLRELGLENVDLRVQPVEELPGAVAALPGASFDLVVVDFLEAPAVTRIDALEPAMKRVGPGGYLLLDDSDRPGYAPAYELLAGWKERRFTGIKDGWPEACETTIFRRPK